MNPPQQHPEENHHHHQHRSSSSHHPSRVRAPEEQANYNRRQDPRPPPPPPENPRVVRPPPPAAAAPRAPAEPPPQWVRPPPPLIPEDRRLEGLDRWLENYGLPAGPAPVTAVQREEWGRFEEMARYQQALHERFFASYQKQEQAQQHERQQWLHLWQQQQAQVHLRTAPPPPDRSHPPHHDDHRDDDHEQLRAPQIIVVPLTTLAQSCDTVYSMARWWTYHHHHQHDLPMPRVPRPPTGSPSARSRSPSSEHQHLHLSLESYPSSSVHDFLRLVKHHNAGNDPEITDSLFDTTTATTFPAVEIRDLIEADSMVHCCQMAHYLQHEALLQATHQVLVECLDEDNCWSLYQLADGLGLSLLWERSLSYMMRSMMMMMTTTTPVNHHQEGSPTANNNRAEAETDSTPEFDTKMTTLPPDLRDRIVAIRSVLQSSVLVGGGSRRGGVVIPVEAQAPEEEGPPRSGGDAREKLRTDPVRDHPTSDPLRIFFSSPDEYLSIFAERIQYDQERLADAREQLSRLTEGTAAWIDTSTKIENQARRIQTLRAVLAEHKKVFAGWTRSDS